MKNLLILLFLVFISSSCIDNKEDLSLLDKEVSYLDPFMSVKATTYDGNTSIVTVKETGDTVLITNKPVDYLFPKGYGLITTYSNDIKYQNGGMTLISQTLAFEDSKDGDYDYNDLVVYMDYKNFYDNDGKDIVRTEVSIIPIALGATKKIGFGYILPNGQDVLITNDCRNDMFDGVKGFINTVKGSPSKSFVNNKIRKYHEFTITSNLFRINPYILVNGQRIFCATSRHHDEEFKYKDVINEKGYPYGISIYGIFEYPNEYTKIDLAYPKFDSWKNGHSDIFTNQKQTKHLYGY